ncbi:MAG: mannose-1-phosphate guanylyltransferase, partial [Cellulomonas sp. 14-74-6]
FGALLQAAGGTTLGDDAAVLRVDAADALVVTGGRTVSVVGVPGAVVVDTADAVLVTTCEHAQAVKAAVDGWRARGREDLL